MGDLKSVHERLRHLQSQAIRLSEIGLVLNTWFIEEAGELDREDEALRLTKTCRTVVEQLEQLEQTEMAASRGHSRADLVLSLVELGVTAIAPKRNRLSAIADCLINGPTSRKQPFRLVMAYVGPGGLPKDTGAISISQQAREANQPELEIMNRLREAGYLLFRQEEFCRLIDRVAGDIRAGKLCLPIARDGLAEIAALSKPGSSIKITRLH